MYVVYACFPEAEFKSGSMCGLGCHSLSVYRVELIVTVQTSSPLYQPAKGGGVHNVYSFPLTGHCPSQPFGGPGK